MAKLKEKRNKNKTEINKLNDIILNNNDENKILIRELKTENDNYKKKNLQVDNYKQEIIELNNVIISNNDSDEIIIKELKQKMIN